MNLSFLKALAALWEVRDDVQQAGWYRTPTAWFFLAMAAFWALDGAGVIDLSEIEIEGLSGQAAEAIAGVITAVLGLVTFVRTTKTAVGSRTVKAKAQVIETHDVIAGPDAGHQLVTARIEPHDEDRIVRVRVPGSYIKRGMK